MVEPFRGDMNLVTRQDLTLVDGGRSLRVKTPVLKTSVGAAIIWLGLRELDDTSDPVDQRNDLARFNHELKWSRQFGMYKPLFEFPQAEIMEDSHPAFQRANRDFLTFLNALKDQPLAVFIIATEEVVRRPWFSSIGETIKDWRRKLNAADTYTYQILLGRSYEFYKEGQKYPKSHFTPSSMRAADFGAVYLPYNSDYPSVSLNRLVEFMNRVMGCDLPGEEFPDYSFDDLRKMAWHISKEDFNAWGPRGDAIPKYPIVNGRPQFAF